MAITLVDAKIEKTRDEIIDAFRAVMSDTYDLHDERITALEEEVGIKPRKH